MNRPSINETRMLNAQYDGEVQYVYNSKVSRPRPFCPG